MQEEGSDELEEGCGEEEEDKVGDMVELSIKSVVGLTSIKTMKLDGSILGQKVID